MLMAKSFSRNDHKLIGRFSHHTVAVGDSLYAWGGDQVGSPKVHNNEGKRKFISKIQKFTPSTGHWINKDTTGPPPLGVRGYFCTAIHNQLYYFGGHCNHDECYHNNITQLDTVSFQWRDIELTDVTRPVMRRANGGMLSFEHDGVHHLLMIGGIGSKPAVQLQGNSYTNLPNGRWRTNEHSMYELSSQGKWSSPSIIGECIPPASSFVFEKISNTRAVLFGGWLNGICSSALYLLEVSVSLNIVYWQCIKNQSPPWPAGRWGHAGTIINGTFLMISGGMDENKRILNDSWAYNINLSSWKMIPVPESFSQRVSQSLSVIYTEFDCVWLVSVGGLALNRSREQRHSQTLCISDDTILIKIDQTFLSPKESQEKYEQLKLQGKDQLMDHGYQTRINIEIAQIENTKQALMRDLLVKEGEVKIMQQELIQRDVLITQIKRKQEQLQLQQKETNFKAKRTFQQLQLQKQQDDLHRKMTQTVDVSTMTDAQIQNERKLHTGPINDDYQYLVSSLDSFESIDVPEKQLFIICGDSSHFFNWEGYGLRITVHQGTVLPSDTLGIAVGAFIQGGQKFPEDTELVSAVYAVIFSKAPLKPIQLEMQHCVSVESAVHSSYLSFASALLTKPPYNFRIKEGGTFPSGNRYGYINTSKSHLWSLIIKPFRRRHANYLSFPKQYFCQVVYEIKIPGRKWKMKIFFGKDLGVIIKHLQGTLRKQQTVKELDLTFQFEIVDEHIEFCFDACREIPGWTIQPHAFPIRASQEAIDKNDRLSSFPYPPQLVTIKATPGIDTNSVLSYPIELKGIKSDIEKLNIVLTMDDVVQPPVSASTIQSSSLPFSPGCEVATPVLKKNFDSLLEMLAVSDNLLILTMALYSNELITKDTVTEIKNTGKSVCDRSASLLLALEATIKTQPQSIKTLIEVLKTKEAFRIIAEQMEKELGLHNYNQ